MSLSSVRTEPELKWLRSFLTMADASYLYRQTSLFCSERGLDSLGALCRCSDALRSEGFYRFLLSATRERLEQALGAGCARHQVRRQRGAEICSKLKGTHLAPEAGR